MRNFKVFTHSVLLTTTSSLFACPQDSLPGRVFQRETQINLEVKQSENSHQPTYDEILSLLDELESGELEKRATAEDLEKINQFVALLAKEGTLDYDFSLECDIAALSRGGERGYDYAYSYGNDYEYMTPGEVFLCKSWAAKQWHQTKKFVKKHKKAIIIGAIIVVAATIVIVAVVTASAASAAVASAAAATAAASANVAASSSSSVSMEPSPVLKASLDEQIASFKDTIVKEQFFQDCGSSVQGLSLEENGRTLGSLFAHESFKNLDGRLYSHPNLSSQFQSPISGENNGFLSDFGHLEIDRKFSTDYSSMYGAPTGDADFNTLAFQLRGEKALESGYWDQAVYDLGRAIELDPARPLPYLERGVAHFGLGEYDRSLEDYRQFTEQTQKQPLSLSDFSLGFAKGLPQGIYDSGEGLFLFLTDFIKHPIHTSGQVIDSITTLVNLVQSDEWGVVAEALSPEVHQLVSQWDTLSSDKRGELAGYAVGKHGADILMPGALVKVASKSVKSAQELASICKNLQIAQETLVLETAAGIGNGARIAELIQSSQKTIGLAEELGFPVQEIALLKQSGQLEGTVAKAVEHFAKNPALRESWELFEKAQDFFETLQ